MQDVETRSDALNPVLSDVDIHQLAAEIAQAARETGFERRLRIGELVWARLFSGQLDERQLAGCQSQITLRRLRKVLGGSMSKSDLHRCVETFLLCRALPVVPTLAHLKVSHVDVVAGLPRQLQEELLLAADGNRWSCRQLRQVALNTVSDKTGRRELLARSAAPVLLPAAERLTTELQRLADTLLRDGPERSLEAREQARLIIIVQVVRRACEEMQRSVEARLRARRAELGSADGEA
jgi:hypothetical protein